MSGELDSPWLIFIGPAGAGKSTVGQEIGDCSGRPFVDLDAVAAPYYAETGWTLDRLRERIASVGRLAAEHECEPARAHAVVRAVADHHGAVLALGAGHTCYRQAEHLKTVRTALGTCPLVIRLLPSRDRDEALLILRERCERAKNQSWLVDGHDLLAEWLDDQGSRDPTTWTVITAGETPAATATRILGAVL